MKQPKYTRGSYKSNPLKQWSVRVHEHEKQLVKHIPEEQIPLAHHWLILHGRYVCLARTPKCPVCQIKSACKYFSSKKKN